MLCTNEKSTRFIRDMSGLALGCRVCTRSFKVKNYQGFKWIMGRYCGLLEWRADSREEEHYYSRENNRIQSYAKYHFEMQQ